MCVCVLVCICIYIQVFIVDPKVNDPQKKKKKRKHERLYNRSAAKHNPFFFQLKRLEIKAEEFLVPGRRRKNRWGLSTAERDPFKKNRLRLPFTSFPTLSLSPI